MHKKNNEEIQEEKNRVIVIAGPTASGKTALSIELAKQLNGEIISADSMQVYKYMDIGTAKPSVEEMQFIKHHLIDVVLPDEDFNVALYKEMAERCISEIIKRNKVPIIVGGTGLYIDTLVKNIVFTDIESNCELRKSLEKEANQYGAEYLHSKLMLIDPISAVRIHPNNVKRVVRALEVFQLTGKPISEHQVQSRMQPSAYEYWLFGIELPRERLYQRIEERVDIMIQSGLVDEVKRLINMGYSSELTSMQALGYKEIIRFLNSELTLEEAIYVLKRDTRRFAKRQLTWFRRYDDMKWLPINSVEDLQKNIENINNYLAYDRII